MVEGYDEYSPVCIDTGRRGATEGYSFASEKRIQSSSYGPKAERKFGVIHPLAHETVLLEEI